MGREERIQNYMCTKNGQPHGTFLVPPEVEAHDCKEHQSFYVFQNQTNCKKNSQYERLFNGEKDYDPKTHRDDLDAISMVQFSNLCGACKLFEQEFELNTDRRRPVLVSDVDRIYLRAAAESRGSA